MGKADTLRPVFLHGFLTAGATLLTSQLLSTAGSAPVRSGEGPVFSRKSCLEGAKGAGSAWALLKGRVLTQHLPMGSLWGDDVRGLAGAQSPSLPFWGPSVCVPKSAH